MNGKNTNTHTRLHCLGNRLKCLNSSDKMAHYHVLERILIIIKKCFLQVRLFSNTSILFTPSLILSCLFDKRPFAQKQIMDSSQALLYSKRSRPFNAWANNVKVNNLAEIMIKMIYIYKRREYDALQ